MFTIHPTAVVGPAVSFGPDCDVGPYCVLEGRIDVGARSRFSTGVVVGAAPMDRKYCGEASGVRIGSDNSFHEYASVHRSTGAGSATVIGSGNMVMAYVHIAHNCVVGDGCVITNGVQLGGHVEVGDGVNIGGLTGVHQFCRIGRLAMIGACSYVNKDIPPFVIAAGRPCRVRGLNAVGLRRAGVGTATIAALRAAFRVIYRSTLTATEALARIEEDLVPQAPVGAGREHVDELVRFCRASRRGIELRTGPPADAVTTKEDS